MTKAFKLNWHLEVPAELTAGCTAVDRWTEDGDHEPECAVKVDDCGFFIHWKSEPREGDVLELSQVNDIRPGKLPQVRVRTNGKIPRKRARESDSFFPTGIFTLMGALAVIAPYVLHYVHYSQGSAHNATGTNVLSFFFTHNRTRGC